MPTELTPSTLLDLYIHTRTHTHFSPWMFTSNNKLVLFNTLLLSLSQTEDTLTPSPTGNNPKPRWSPSAASLSTSVPPSPRPTVCCLAILKSAH